MKIELAKLLLGKVEKPPMSDRCTCGHTAKAHAWIGEYYLERNVCLIGDGCKTFEPAPPEPKIQEKIINYAIWKIDKIAFGEDNEAQTW